MIGYTVAGDREEDEDTKTFFQRNSGLVKDAFHIVVEVYAFTAS